MLLTGDQEFTSMSLWRPFSFQTIIVCTKIKKKTIHLKKVKGGIYGRDSREGRKEKNDVGILISKNLKKDYKKRKKGEKELC